ncbi:ABC transporter substrate-binding protein [Pseudonocardia acidicola]|uniref:ABC transporter substrate-binding protein n=1 Tax=Pseudonocardia acidicola TaxID=2724939 RepID=A0ABX1SLX0_9PSEU|nr:ABC transporter substrate-binding protein [Pseudonocardia acidicola]NMI01838.1 ABC transporter substrate-binding protein [Pseudonocardia acidicola]
MRIRRRHTAIRALSVGVGIALAAGCSAAAQSGTGSNSGPIVIGHTAGMTGFMSVFDLPVEQGMKMAIEDINAKGGVLGRQLELITTNNESDPTKIQSAAQEVIEKGAQFVVPSCDYDIGGPAARTANDQNIIAIGCAGGPLFGYDGTGPMTYNLHQASPAEGSTMAQWAFSKGYRKPFVITDTGLEYSQVDGQYFTKKWRELGGGTAGEDTYQNGDQSAASQIADIQKSGADLVVIASYPPGGATLIRQIRAAGITLPMVGTQAFDGTYWLDAVPDLSNFYVPVTASMYGDDPITARNEFFQRVQQETGKPAASAFYPLTGYSSVQALARAIERAGTTDSKAVAAKLDTFTDEDLLLGPTTYTPTCHIPSFRPQLVIQYTAGKPAVVQKDVRLTDVPGGAPC